MTVDEKTIGETDIKDGDFLVVTVTIAKVLINNVNLEKLIMPLRNILTAYVLRCPTIGYC